jgi:hypothetical protein
MADSLGPLVRSTRVVRPDQPGPVGRTPSSLSLDSNLTLTLIALVLSGDCESPSTSSLDSGELRRSPPSPCGAFAQPPHALSSDRGDLSASPPFVAIASARRPGRSRPLRLDLLWLDHAGVSAPLLSVCCCVSAAIAGWKACLQPRPLPGVVLCLAAWPWARCCSAPS